MTVDEMLARLRSLLPPWWPTQATLLDAILGGTASTLKWIFDFIGYAGRQTRLKTMDGIWLDLFAFDFFGLLFRRRDAEGDDVWGARIQREMFRERVTRTGISTALFDLTGRSPILIEPWNPGDCGAYDEPQSCGYDTAGVLGSYDMPYQILVQAFHPFGEGIPFVAGYDDSQGGYDAGGSEYVDIAQSQGAATAADIFHAVDITRAAGVTAWVQVNP